MLRRIIKTNNRINVLFLSNDNTKDATINTFLTRNKKRRSESPSQTREKPTIGDLNCALNSTAHSLDNI